MHSERLALPASVAALVLFFIALVMSNASQAAPLAAFGDHTGQDHSFENHGNEDLTSIILTDATLEGTNLRDSILDSAIAIRTDFTNAQLRDTSLLGATLTDAVFAGAQLRDADLTGAWAAGADFSGALLRNTMLSGVNFDGANLSGANANNADFTGASFLGADLTGMTNVDPSLFAGAYYDLATVLDPGFDTSQMILVPEPRPIVFISLGLLTFALLPERLRPIDPTRPGPDAPRARAELVRSCAGS